jgi:acetoin utilization deacetylase AcuC-like enzyme
VVAAARAAGLIDLVTPEFHEGDAWADIASIHSPRFVEAVRTGSPTRLAESQGFRWSPEFATSVVRIWEGHQMAARMALGHPSRLVFHPVSGAHHARPEAGSGFCTFNFLIGTAKGLIRERRVDRVAIIDLDAHPGDGTWEFLKRGVLTRRQLGLFDIAGSRWCRVPSEDFTCYADVRDAAEYFDALGLLPTFLDQFQPDLVLYQAGMDPHEHDHVGAIPGMTWAALARRDRCVLHACMARRIATVVNLAGGYQEDGSTVRGHVETFWQAWTLLNRKGSHENRRARRARPLRQRKRGRPGIPAPRANLVTA